MSSRFTSILKRAYWTLAFLNLLVSFQLAVTGFSPQRAEEPSAATPVRLRHPRAAYPVYMLHLYRSLLAGNHLGQSTAEASALKESDSILSLVARSKFRGSLDLINNNNNLRGITGLGLYLERGDRVTVRFQTPVPYSSLWIAGPHPGFHPLPAVVCRGGPIHILHSFDILQIFLGGNGVPK